jgi:hypothetical protein
MKNMENDRDGRTHDLYREEDIPKSNILDIEIYMDKHAEEIVDFMEKKITEKSQKEIKITGEISDRIILELTKEMPFGPTRDWIHIVLSNALISSLWCGWISQSMVDKNEPKFKAEYLNQFKRAITKAYEIGQKYAGAQSV